MLTMLFIIYILPTTCHKENRDISSAWRDQETLDTTYILAFEGCLDQAFSEVGQRSYWECLSLRKIRGFIIITMGVSSLFMSDSSL